MSQGDESLRALLESRFPKLRSSNYDVISPQSTDYNCIAWAAGVSDRTWWPLKPHYWPPGALQKESIQAFVSAFSTLGYAVCEDGSLEKGWEKVAIYQVPDGSPTHACRQIDHDKWTSKLGPNVDIEHEVHALDESKKYGSITTFMKRPRFRI